MPQWGKATDFDSEVIYSSRYLWVRLRLHSINFGHRNVETQKRRFFSVSEFDNHIDNFTGIKKNCWQNCLSHLTQSKMQTIITRRDM